MTSVMNRRAILGLVAASPFASVAIVRAQTQKVRIAAVPTDSFGLAFSAQDNGAFAKAGLDVELVQFPQAGPIANAVGGGAVDVGLADPIQLAQAVIRGLPFRYIAGGSLYSSKAPTTQLCVQQGGAIKSGKDLAGKTVGVYALGAFPEYATRAWLEAQGVDISTIKLFEVPSGSMAAAIARGVVAAGVVSEPFLTQAPAVGVVPFAKVYDACAPSFYNNGWFVTTTWLQANPDLAHRVVTAVYDTARWAETHHADPLQILAKYGKLDTVAAAHMNRAVWSTSMNVDALKPPLALGWRYHAMDRQVAVSELVAPSAR